MSKSKVGNIGEWLNRLELGQYAQAFAENDIDFRSLSELTEDDLKEIGVSLGHRRILLKAIADLAESAPPDPIPAAPFAEAERRHLTVMFCDLVGSTELSFRLDPEDLRGIIQLYQSSCAKVVERYGGYIAQYLGDGIFVYFGYPQALEDAADRAVRTGLELVSAVADLPASGAKLQVRIGIATGIAVVGDLIGKGASEMHAVIGQVPNLAARVQSMAEPGSLVIADSTKRLIGVHYDFHDLGLQRIKGIDSEVHVWQVLRERQDAARFDSPRLTRSTCLGRERELEFLLAKWRETLTGAGQVVLAWGEAGIGKSRLLLFFSDQLSGQAYRHMTLQCSPQHGSSPLYPFIRAFLNLLAFAPADSVSDKLDRIEALLSVSGQIDSVPLLAALLSIPYAERYAALTLSAQAQKAATLNFCVDYVIAMSRKQPMLFQIEDAHWIDPTSEELLARLIARINFQPILILVTMRPAYEPAWMDLSHENSLSLGRLGEADVRSIVRSIAAGKPLPEELMLQILTKTDGVPLFVEELTLAVLESGLLRETADAWVLDGPLPAIDIPDTLQDSLMARLDRLAPAKEVLQAASAIGRRFSYAMLAAVLNQPESMLRAALGRLVEAELIYPPVESNRREYLFKHALVQDAAYESLLKSRRQALHARIFQALEMQFPETVEYHPELLALHAARAGLAEQAIDYGLKAGQRSLARSANKEALVHLRQALDLLGILSQSKSRDITELALQLACGQASRVVHGFVEPETVAAFERSQYLAERVGTPEQYEKLISGLNSIYTISGRLDQAAANANDVVERAKLRGDQSLAYIGDRLTGFNALTRGDLTSACTHLRQAMENPNQLNAIPAYSFFAWAQSLAGHPDTALRFSEIALNRSRAMNHTLTVGEAMFHNCFVHRYRKDYRALLVTSKATHEFCEKHNIRYFGAWARALKIYAEMKLSNSETGFQEYLAALAELAHVGVFAMTYWHTQTADLLRERGQVKNAIGELEKAHGLIAACGEHWYEPETERVHAECLMALTPPATLEAENCFRRALDKAHEMGALTFELTSALGFYGFLAALGRAAEGIAILAPIYARITEGLDLPDQRAARAILGAI